MKRRKTLMREALDSCLVSSDRVPLDFSEDFSKKTFGSPLRANDVSVLAVEEIFETRRIHTLAMLIASNHLELKEIAARVGMGVQQVNVFLSRPKFLDLVKTYVDEYAVHVRKYGIADKNARLAAYSRMWEACKRVRAEGVDSRDRLAALREERELLKQVAAEVADVDTSGRSGGDKYEFTVVSNMVVNSSSPGRPLGTGGAKCLDADYKEIDDGDKRA